MCTPERSSDRRPSGQRGIAIITTAVSTLLLIPILGLAIDVAFLYGVRAKLSAAADASVLAAARSDDPQAARERAQAFFQANFPAGFLNTSDPRLDFEFGRQLGDGNRSITLTVAVDAPTFFFGALGIHETTLRAVARAEERSPSPVLIG